MVNKVICSKRAGTHYITQHGNISERHRTRGIHLQIRCLNRGRFGPETPPHLNVIFLTSQGNSGISQAHSAAVHLNIGGMQIRYKGDRILCVMGQQRAFHLQGLHIEIHHHVIHQGQRSACVYRQELRQNITTGEPLRCSKNGIFTHVSLNQHAGILLQQRAGGQLFKICSRIAAEI